jgi:hypothetical protein
MLKYLALVALLVSSVFAGSGTQAQSFSPTPVVYLSAASNNSTLVATGARFLHSVTAINTTATIYYLRLYDLAAAPTCSSATGVVANFPIPASTTGAGMTVNIPSAGLLFSAGLGFCLTGAAPNNDNTNAATGVHINLGYR